MHSTYPDKYWCGTGQPEPAVNYYRYRSVCRYMPPNHTEKSSYMKKIFSFFLYGIMIPFLTNHVRKTYYSEPQPIFAFATVHFVHSDLIRTYHWFRHGIVRKSLCEMSFHLNQKKQMSCFFHF